MIENGKKTSKKLEKIKSGSFKELNLVCVPQKLSHKNNSGRPSPGLERTPALGDEVLLVSPYVTVYGAIPLDPICALREKTTLKIC